jgi:hypothetical protein
MPDTPSPATQFAIRVAAIDALFAEFDARPLPERPLASDARLYLLDAWERVRKQRPSTLTVYAPESERQRTDENAVRAAIRADLHAATGPLKRVRPRPRHEKVAFRIGIAFLFICVGLSGALTRESNDVIIQGIGQGILVIGWVALWGPAAHFALEVVPHRLNRKRYAEFADIDVRFVWA